MKKEESIAQTHRKAINKNPEKAQALDFLNKDFNLAILNMFRELKETMFKEWKKK